jgi:hypothetical protein
MSGAHRLNRLIARSIPSVSQHSTASAIGSSSSPTARHSSGSNGPSTKSASSVSPSGTGPTPIRSRA